MAGAGAGGERGSLDVVLAGVLVCAAAVATYTVHARVFAGMTEGWAVLDDGGSELYCAELPGAPASAPPVRGMSSRSGVAAHAPSRFGLADAAACIPMRLDHGAPGAGRRSPAALCLLAASAPDPQAAAEGLACD